ncbi:MAG: methyltransferase domain-containing protein [Alphaproteobacteria bacterium]|nr:methyltransferase domain-containing protein [Alphaproteobacteria bacterium]
MAQNIDTALNEARRLHARRDYDGALGAYAAILAADPSRLDALDPLVAILEMARTPAFHPRLAALIESALALPGANTEALTQSATHQLALKYRMADPQQAPARDLLLAMARDGLMLSTLSNCIVRDTTFESFMCRVRRALCVKDAPVAFRPLVLALARQADNNEYLWPQDEQDAAALGALGDDAYAVACRAMYSRVDAGASTDPDLAQFVAILTGLREKVRAAETRIPALAPLADTTSREVGAMYEENPYPRWLNLRRIQPFDIRAELSQRFAFAGPFPVFAQPLRVLMPGAGTGQHPLSVAANYANVEVEAIDLSLASLAYGLTMAMELGIANIHFAQADILDLPKLGSSWGHAESIGVLHHMADPKAGLAAICEVVVPGSFVRLGLYGEHARAVIVEARDAITRYGYKSDLPGLRAFRADVMAGKLGERLKRELPQWADFHSASLLRDLCFHVMEHRYDIAKLRALLAGLPLRFLGFDFSFGHAAARTEDVPALRAYAKKFPKETSFSDLADWEAIERADPALFGGYQFWLVRT